MIVVFECEAVHAGIHSKRLAHCDTLAAASFFCAPCIQVRVIVVVLIGREVLLDIIVEVVVVVVDHFMTRLFLRDIATQITNAVSRLAVAILLNESHVGIVVVTLAEVEARFFLAVELSQQVVCLSQMFVGAVCWSTGRYLWLRQFTHGERCNLFYFFSGGTHFLLGGRSRANTAGVEGVEDLEQERLLLIIRDACLASEFQFVKLGALKIGFWFEHSQGVVQAVKLHKLLDQLSHQCSLLRLSQYFGFRVLEVEGALTRLNLILVINGLEDTRAQLGPDLA